MDEARINQLKKYINKALFILFLSLFFLNTALSNIKIMTYNVNLLPNIPISSLTEHLNHPYERARLIPYEIAKYNPDVVVFQEDISLIMYLILDDNMEKVGYPYKTKVVGSLDFNHINLLMGGVIIYSKYPFAERPQYLVLPKSFGWEATANKGAVFTAIKKDNKVYNVISVHMQSIQYNSANKDDQILRWKVQMGALNQWIANLNISANEPLILAGDINADSGKAIKGEMPVLLNEYPLYQYALYALDARQAAVYGKDTLPYSFDGTTNTMNYTAVSETLDHVLCFKGYVCPIEDKSSIAIVAPKSSMLEEPDLSDHYAVIADLNYN